MSMLVEYDDNVYSTVSYLSYSWVSVSVSVARTSNLRRSVVSCCCFFFFFFQAEDGIRDLTVTGVQTCALPISRKLPLGTSPLREESPSAVPALRPQFVFGRFAPGQSAWRRLRTLRWAGAPILRGAPD